MEDLGFLVKKVSRVLTGYQDKLLKELRSTQLQVLGVIEENLEKTNVQLAKILMMDRTTFGRNIKLLIDQEYAIEYRDTVDARKKHYKLTAKAKKALREGKKILEIFNDKLMYSDGLYDKSIHETLMEIIRFIEGLKKEEKRDV